MRTTCDVFVALLFIAMFAFVLWGVSACSTVRPDLAPARRASFDGSAQTSGLIALNPDGGANITANARNRYNNLVELYGRDFLPALARDAGVKPHGDGATFDVDAQHLVYFGQMAGKYRSGIAPKP